ncbi:dienelactone hydrolase family protein [Oryzobacter terrae]|uniref:dienelactone hydrolase family protein n=1 Tax=Oryzobacter terrae TaxID=1620385 RepID=UPI00366A7817
MGETTSVGDLPAYRAVPEGEGPWPGLVLVHELFGLDDEMRRHADRLAGMGHLVLAPDLVSRGNRALCLLRTMTALRRGRGRTFDDIDAARADLASDPRCTGSIGVIGFCMGGGFALLLAARPGWDVVVANYGVVPDAEELVGSCPVVASYGGRDLYLRGAARRLETTLTAQGVANDVREYPAAGHAFLNASHTAPWWALPMSRLVMRAGPEPASAQHAWGRIEAFLATHLRA